MCTLMARGHAMWVELFSIFAFTCMHLANVLQHTHAHTHACVHTHTQTHNIKIYRSRALYCSHLWSGISCSQKIKTRRIPIFTNRRRQGNTISPSDLVICWRPFLSLSLSPILVSQGVWCLPLLQCFHVLLFFLIVTFDKSTFLLTTSTNKSPVFIPSLSFSQLTFIEFKSVIDSDEHSPQLTDTSVKDYLGRKKFILFSVFARRIVAPPLSLSISTPIAPRLLVLFFSPLPRLFPADDDSEVEACATVTRELTHDRGAMQRGLLRCQGMISSSTQSQTVRRTHS